MASSPITSWQKMRTQRKSWQTIFLCSKITADSDCSHEIKTIAPWNKSYDQATHHIKKQTHYFADSGPSDQSYGFFSSHVWM